MIGFPAASLAAAGEVANERAAVFVASAEGGSGFALGATAGAVLLAAAGLAVIVTAASLVITARLNAGNRARLATVERRLTPSGGADV